MEFRVFQEAFPSATWERGSCGRQLLRRAAYAVRATTEGRQLPIGGFLSANRRQDSAKDGLCALRKGGGIEGLFLGHPAGEHVAQRLEADGLAEIIVHARLDAL